MKIHLEIRPGEGGDDAKDLVFEQAKIYSKFSQMNGLSFSFVDNSKS